MIDLDAANAALLETALTILHSFTPEQLEAAEQFVAGAAALFLTVGEDEKVGPDYDVFLQYLRVSAPYTEDFITTGQDMALTTGAEAALDFLLTLIEELKDAHALKELDDSLRAALNDAVGSGVSQSRTTLN